MITVRPAESEDEWEGLISRCPQKTLFHTWKALKIIERHANSVLHPVVGLSGTNPVGVLPLFFKKESLRKNVYSPPPGFGIPYLGPLILDYDTLKQSKKESIYIDFHKAADRFIFSALKANHALIRTTPGIIDSRPFKWSGYSVEPLYSYIIDIDKNKAGPSAPRTEDKITIIQGSRTDLENLCKTSERRSPALRDDYVLDIYDAFHPAGARLFIVKSRGECLGGHLTLYCNDKAIRWVRFAKKEGKGINIDDPLHEEEIRVSHEKGCRYFEMQDENTCGPADYGTSLDYRSVLWYSAEKYSSFTRRLLEKAPKKK